MMIVGEYRSMHGSVRSLTGRIHLFLPQIYKPDGQIGGQRITSPKACAVHLFEKIDSSTQPIHPLHPPKTAIVVSLGANGCFPFACP